MVNTYAVRRLRKINQKAGKRAALANLIDDQEPPTDLTNRTNMFLVLADRPENKECEAFIPKSKSKSMSNKTKPKNDADNNNDWFDGNSELPSSYWYFEPSLMSLANNGWFKGNRELPSSYW